MTHKLSFVGRMLCVKEVEMVEIVCLWCETTLRVEAQLEDQQLTCPECLTSWVLEDDPQAELALAA